MTPDPRPATRSPGLDALLAEARTAAGDLAHDIQAALAAEPTRQAQLARRLAERSAQVLARFADAAVVEATRHATYEQVAADLNVHRSAVGKAVMRINGKDVPRGSRGKNDGGRSAAAS